MSTALGIASVTQVLKNLLNNGLIENNISTVIGTTVAVSSLPPSLIDQGTSATDTQLNLFLYRASVNTGWNNVGYPSRDTRGELVNNPPLALNLHYLLTAFGDVELHAEILLGYGMQLLHETPVLERGRIRQSLSVANLPANLQALSGSELADQIEMIKVTPEPINAEEISKLWTAFQTRYRPSTAYQATVLLIESKKPTRSPLPVRETVLYPFPFKQPVLEKVLSQVSAGDPILENQQILVGHTLVLRGHSLKRDPLHVLLSGASILINQPDATDTEVRLVLPGSLKAGIQGVQVVHSIEMGTPAQARRIVESNLLSFVLSPDLNNPVVSNTNNTSGNLFSADISVDVSPAVHPYQRAILLLNQINLPPGSTPASYSFILPTTFWDSNTSPVGTLPFEVTGVLEGDYLIRIQVDGAESPLTTNNVGTFNGPQINIS
ncbi:MAG: DUF4255 domain-containing protein [Phaeodactylibacter sp.]|nr:DUF4255 domain-containing protein [Phaeodactylibacter sp.]MCB9286248.1 DUF4255 domain-containing protein [Lewinellaceae bacterium]